MSLPAQDKKQQNNEYNFHKNNVLRVSNAAKILGISPSSLRRFEEEGRISSFRDPGNGYRYYRSNKETNKSANKPITKFVFYHFSWTDFFIIKRFIARIR